MRKALLTLTTVLTVAAGHAQSPTAARYLTFEEALQMTYGQNGQLEALRYEREAAVQEKKAATGLRFPQITAAAAYTYMSDDMAIDLNPLKKEVAGIIQQVPELGLLLPPQVVGGLIGKNWSMTLQQKDFALAGATVALPLYTGGKINTANRVAKLRISETDEKTRQTRGELFSQLVERYFGLSLAQQVVKVRAEVLAGMNRHLYDAEQLEKNGMVARAERLYAQMYVAEAEKDLQKAVRDVRTINIALGNTLNSQNDYAPLTSLFVVSRVEDVDYFKNAARENNPLLHQVDLKERLAREAVKYQRAAFVPQLAAMGGIDAYHYQLTKLAPRWVVGAGVKWNLFDGLNREFKYSAAKQRVRQVESLREQAASDISTLVEKVYNEMMTNGEQIRALDAAIEFGAEYLRIQEKAFVEGTASSSDVVDARLNLAKYKIERLQAAYNYDVCLAKLLETCGLTPRFSDYRHEPGYLAVRYEPVPLPEVPVRNNSK